MAEQSAFLTAFDEMQKKKGGFNAPAPLESVVDTVGQAPAVQSPFSQQAAAATNPLAAPIDLSAAPAVQAPQELTADSFGPVAFPGLQQQGMDTRLQVAGEEQQRMNELSRVKTDAMVADARSSSFFDKTKEVGLGGKFSPILDLADQQRFGVEKPLPEGTLPAQLLKGAGLASDTLDAMGETAVDFTKGAGRVAQNIGEYFTGKDFNKNGGVVPTPAAPVAPVAATPVGTTATSS